MRPGRRVQKIDIRGTRVSRRASHSVEPVFHVTLPKYYLNPLPISKAKYKDLQKLCTDNIIPEKYWDWYRHIPFIDEEANATSTSRKNDEEEYAY